MSDSLSVCVSAKYADTADVCVLELTPVSGDVLPSFTAGSHIDVHLPNGLVRQYSLANDPAESHRYVIAVLREPESRGGSVSVHDDIQVGDTITISAPRNAFPLHEGSAPGLLLAGGIGITPILSMAEALTDAGTDFTFHYCARSSDRMPFQQRLSEARYASQVQLHLDDGAAAQRFDIKGTLNDAADNTQLYICGPAGFIEAVLDAAREQGWPEERLHREFFAPAESADSGEAGVFELRLSKSGINVTVAADQTAVAALEAAGIEVPVSCEQGICGTCLTRVQEGTPDHKDNYLTDEERVANDQFLPCCSRAISDYLVIDL